ncbi:ADP-ribosylation factor-like protein 6-interacting protein 1 [Arapaima gigas]
MFRRDYSSQKAFDLRLVTRFAHAPKRDLPVNAVVRRRGDNRSANIIAQETAQLEEQLQGWGEVILAGDRILRWEKPWFPGALVGVVTLLFVLIYYLDPSVLTGLSCSVMLLCLADYLGTGWPSCIPCGKGLAVCLLVTFLLLLPGLNQHGIVTKYAGMAKREINKLLKYKEKKNE